jgi:hypothetical protein
LLIAAVARCGWKPEVNPPPSSRVIATNVSGVRPQPSASVSFLRKAQVRAEGASKVYTRDGQEGRKLRFHFCPECGTTVYWDLDLRPDHIVVAFGTFADASFPAPPRSVWEETRHPWVEFGHFPQNRTSLARPAGLISGESKKGPLSDRILLSA